MGLDYMIVWVLDWNLTSAFFFYIVFNKIYSCKKNNRFKICSPMTILQTDNFSMALNLYSICKECIVKVELIQFDWEPTA